MSKKDQYVEGLKTEIDQVNAELDRLEDKVQQTEASTQRKYQNLLNELRQRRSELEERLVEVSVAGENAWEELKKGADDAWRIMKDSLKQAKSEFKSGIGD